MKEYLAWAGAERKPWRGHGIQNCAARTALGVGRAVVVEQRGGDVMASGPSARWALRGPNMSHGSRDNLCS